MRTITITFKEFKGEPTDPPGVRIYSQWGDKDKATLRENRYADVAVVLLDKLLQNLPTGECVAVASDEDWEVAEKKIEDQLNVRRATKKGQGPN
jgi:hypothetical protein